MYNSCCFLVFKPLSSGPPPPPSDLYGSKPFFFSFIVFLAWKWSEMDKKKI